MLRQIIDIFDEVKLWEGNLIVNRNDFLNVEGRLDTRLFYIQSGCLRAFVMDGADEHTIRFGYKDDIFTALDSFLSNRPSDFYIQALKKSRLRYVTKAKLYDFIYSKEEYTHTWIKMLEQFNVHQIAREMDLLISSPQERYQRVLKRSPQLFQEVPLKYIANYLRMTPETLSRIRKS